MYDILSHAAQRVQIVVFTCREQLFEGLGVPRQLFLPDASIDFAALTPSLTVDSALHRYDNL